MAKKRRALSLIILFFCQLNFAEDGNSQKSEWKGAIVLENGVKVVKNPREPLYGEIKLELEEDLSIGNPKDESTLYYGLIGIAVDSKDDIFVLDAENDRVQKFDSKGILLATFGRKGQGPGEFGGQPELIHLDQDGNIYVFDSSTGGRLSEFNNGGKFIETIPAPSGTIDFVVLNNKNILLLASFRSKEEMRRGVAIISRQGKRLKNLAEYVWHTLPRKKEWPIGGTAVFPQLYFCPSENVGMFGYSEDYKLFVTDKIGNIAMQVEKDEPREPLTNGEKQARINLFLKNQETIDPRFKLTRDEVERRFGALPKYEPYFGDLKADDLGNIYVERFRPFGSKEQGKTYDFFDNRGRYLYRIKTPPVYFYEIKGGYGYCLSPVGDSDYSLIQRLSIKNWGKLVSWK